MLIANRCRNCGERIASRSGVLRSARRCRYCGRRFAGYHPGVTLALAAVVIGAVLLFVGSNV